MLALPTYDGETALYGLGRSGRACAQALLAAGNRIAAWDDQRAARTAAKLDDAHLRDLHRDFGAPARLVISPGIPLTHAIAQTAQAARIPLIGDMALLQDALARLDPPPKIIAVTGTNGKSTVTALIAHILNGCGFSALAAGNIGTPVLELALPPAEAKPVLVLEVSSYQIELMAHFTPDFAVLTNITPDHLERHGGMAGYVAAKAKLFDALGADGAAFIVGGGAHEQEIAARLRARGIAVTLIAPDAPAAVELLDLAGAHNAQNAALAYAVARHFGVSDPRARAAFDGFSGLEHRLEAVAQCGDVYFVNDSKATNAEATQHALRAFDTIFWLAGGRAKSGGIAALDLGGARGVYLFGEAADDFAAQLAAPLTPHICATLAEAFAAAAQDALTHATRHGQKAVVLLSPAAASFDQFTDFEARGAAFKQLVRDWCAAQEGA